MNSEKPLSVQNNSLNESSKLPAIIPKVIPDQQLIIPDKEPLSFFQKKAPEVFSLQREQESLANSMFPISPLEEISAPEQVLEMETKKHETETKLTAMYHGKEQEMSLHLQEKHSFFMAKQKELVEKEHVMRQQFLGTTSFEDTKKNIQDQSQSILVEFQKIKSMIEDVEKSFRK